MEKTEIIAIVLLNVFSSFLFTLILYWTLKPSIKISHSIAKFTDEDNYPKYGFKIVNKSLFPAYDVRIELIVREFYAADQVSERLNVNYYNLELVTTQIKRIYPKRFNRRIANHAVVLFTYSDIEPILMDSNKTIELVVDSKHGFSVLSKVFTRRYVSMNSVKSGRFNFGNKVDIVD